MQCLRLSRRSYFRRYSSISSGYVLEQLTNRSLIRIYGQDTVTFLQGLITNDIQHLVNGAGSMFAMFLNTKGRVLFDTIIYRSPNNKSFYLEVDRRISDTIIQHLKMYRLRRKVDITPVNELNIWVHFNSYVSVSTTKGPEDKLLQGRIVPCTSLEKSDNTVVTKEIGDKQLLVYRDPRLTALGIRILAPGGTGITLSELFPGSGHATYQWFRYKLGVGEGIDELPPGNCFPLEANCDYLHGISFHKGCYIGQELTARTHHTGVVRKRLMPLYLSQPFSSEPKKDEIIKAKDANVGKLRGYFDKCGIGLIRIAQALEAEKLTVHSTSAVTLRPSWWPLEASKEKVSSGRL